MFKLSKVESTSAIVVAGKIRAHTKFFNGAENIEEWSTKSKSLSSMKKLEENAMELLMRKWRCLDKMGRVGNWEYEISQSNHHVSTEDASLDLISVNRNENPIWSSQWSKPHLLWQAANCKWPLENYSVTVDDNHQTLIIRSKNKKLYRKIQIPALSRANQKLNKAAVSLEYDNKLNRLTILYEKSEAVLTQEKGEKMRVIKAFHRLN